MMLIMCLSTALDIPGLEYNCTFEDNAIALLENILNIVNSDWLLYTHSVFVIIR